MRLLLLLMISTAACNSGPNLSTAPFIDDGRTGGDPGPIDVGGGAAVPPSFPKPPITGTGDGGPSFAEIPFVACSNETPDAGEPDDAEAPKSPCDTPPPSTCVTRIERVEWRPGPCVNGRCVFSQTLTSCPKGCFRQVDGGEGCAR